MLGEVLTPSPAPAHWDNYCRSLPARSFFQGSFGDAESFLDEYFEFVRYRIRYHWEGNKKSNCYAFGVDIKYNQLTRIAPVAWDSSSFPFLLFYLQSRGATLVHTTRNVIHCAISALIASQRNLWHNYDGAVIGRSYQIDVPECLAYARTIVRHRDVFLKATRDCRVVHCPYENLLEDLARAGSRQEIPERPGALRNIATALDAPFQFRYDGRPQKAINIPYSQLLSNYDALVRRLKDSEFSALVPTLA